MKKVTNITLGGFIFVIEEDAYAVLKEYLKSIEVVFADSDDYAEIAADIESAIAEKFYAAHKNEKNAVTAADVENAIKEMGDIEDFAEVPLMGEPAADTNASATTAMPRRLYRNEDDAILGGVASGIATYFDTDPVIVRILFVIAAFINGIGIIAYIILLLIVPAAQTTTQKYAMRGEKVTLSHISQRVKKNLSRIDAQSMIPNQTLWLRLRNVLEKFFELLGTVIRVSFSVLRYAFGLGLVLFGVLGIAAMTSGYMLLLFSEKAFVPERIQEVLDMVLVDPMGILALCATFVAAAIPLLVLAIVGASLWAKKNFLTATKVVVLGIVWIIAATTAGTAAALQAEKVVERIRTFSDTNAVYESHETYFAVQQEFFTASLHEEVINEFGQPIEGYEPSMFLAVFKGLTEADFEGVSAYNGHYTIQDGSLVLQIHNPDVLSSADGAITDRGMRILLENIAARLHIDLARDGALTQILDALSRSIAVPEADIAS